MVNNHLCNTPSLQYTLPVANCGFKVMCECPNIDPCVRFVVGQCSLNLIAGQVFVGACSVGFFSDLYYQGTEQATLFLP